MFDDPVVDIVLISVGVIAIVVAIIWRAGGRRRQISGCSRLLESTDPHRRIEAAVALTELGLDRSARPLFAHARAETDPDVRIGIAAAVARRQWEPAGAPRVTRLREWAASELATQGYNVSSFGPATTRLADMGGPRLPQPLKPSAATAPSVSSPAAAPPQSVPTDTAAGGSR
jgi:hypothetical protein